VRRGGREGREKVKGIRDRREIRLDCLPWLVSLSVKQNCAKINGETQNKNEAESLCHAANTMVWHRGGEENGKKKSAEH